MPAYIEDPDDDLMDNTDENLDAEEKEMMDSDATDDMGDEENSPEDGTNGNLLRFTSIFVIFAVIAQILI